MLLGAMGSLVFAVVFAAAPTYVKADTFSPISGATTLKVGSKGADVRALQSFMASGKDIYPSGVIDGSFGPMTRNGAKQLQLALSLLFFSNTNAAEIGNFPDNNIYKYNALENNLSFFDLTSNANNLTENKLPGSQELLAELVKNLQDVTAKQNLSTLQANEAIDTLKNKNGVITFLVGNNLGVLKFQLVQIKDQIYQLNALTPGLEDNIIKIQIDSQVKSLKEEQMKVENFLLEQNKKFSLFGWFVTIL